MQIQNSAFVQNAKRFYAKYTQFIQKFVYTDYYLMIVAALLFIGWVTKCIPFGLTALIVVSCLVLIGSNDILPLTINIFGAALIIYTDDISQLLFMWPMLLPLIPSFAVFIVRNVKHKFQLGKMFYPQLAVALVLLLGGAGAVSAAGYARALPTALVLGVGVLAVYLLYNHFLKKDSGCDIQTYFAKTMMYIGIVVALELIATIISSHMPVAQWAKSYWEVGWGNRNNIATYLIITAGLTLYLSTKYKQGWIYLIIGMIQYLCIVLSFSRGGIIFGGISGVVALVFAIVKSPDKKRMLISTGAIVAIVLILYFIFMNKVNAMLSSLLSRGMGTSGRTELYLEAWELFKALPVLGGGLGYSGNNFDMSVSDMYYFHSTVLQVLASMGIVGAAAYAYYYAIRVKLLFKNIKKSFNLFVLAVWIGFEGYCIIDAGTFVPYPNMVLIIIMTLLLELNTDCAPKDLYHAEYGKMVAEGSAEEIDANEEIGVVFDTNAVEESGVISEIDAAYDTVTPNEISVEEEISISEENDNE